MIRHAVLAEALRCIPMTRRSRASPWSLGRPLPSRSRGAPGRESTVTGPRTWPWPHAKKAGPQSPGARRRSWSSTSTPTCRPTWTAAEIAGPGFVNFHLRTDLAARGAAPTVRRRVAPTATPQLDIGTGTTVNVEFVSANPTGPVARRPCPGCGPWRRGCPAARTEPVYQVTREFYINDRGVQMQKFGESLIGPGKAGQPVADDGYLGTYITEWAKHWATEVVAHDDVDLRDCGARYAAALADQREALGAFNVALRRVVQRVDPGRTSGAIDRDAQRTAGQGCGVRRRP